MALDTLSNLADIGAGTSSGSPASTAASAASAATPSTGPQWLSGKLAQVSFVLLGLLFIAAGIFSFDKTREIVVQAGKTVAAA